MKVQGVQGEPAPLMRSKWRARKTAQVGAHVRRDMEVRSRRARSTPSVARVQRPAFEVGGRAGVGRARRTCEVRRGRAVSSKGGANEHSFERRALVRSTGRAGVQTAWVLWSGRAGSRSGWAACAPSKCGQAFEVGGRALEVSGTGSRRGAGRLSEWVYER